MRIAILTGSFYPNIGGMEILCEVLANEFVAAGHDVLVLTDTPSRQEDNDRFSFRVYRGQTFARRLFLFRSSDIILSFALSLRRCPEQLLSFRPIMIHHPNPITAADGSTRLLDRAKHLLSSRLVNIVPSRYMSSKIAHSIIIPNPYNHRLFEYRGQEKRREVLFVGRLAAVKGVDILLRAISLAFRSVPPFHSTFVGEGPEREKYLQLATTLGIADYVHFSGPKRGIELVDIMCRHQIMVVPSSYEEPFGIVALEGLACRCTMIVSNSGGLVDAVGPHALVFENRNFEELARCLVLALTQHSVRDQLLKGLEEHLLLHRADQIASEYIAVLRKMVASPTGSATPA
ncbi:glycosyltransferase family 4 protein [Bradyrhizobium sp. 187]|uniref:glycosyltransferase family 4 protein n=1 Tax=Bradyrhizobium sp. 187 TaxID=2782655 RepID=UPI001FFF02EE|nr:glycosyltransferase family 4 protein [Bradyrhizobium sp. 187]UPJ74483.1 glycosyltransferase family 4 protein [Bradyrhizobium sp. 187]